MSVIIRVTLGSISRIVWFRIGNFVLFEKYFIVFLVSDEFRQEIEVVVFQIVRMSKLKCELRTLLLVSDVGT